MPLNLSKHPDSDNPASRLLSLLERGEPDIHVSGVKGSYPSLLSSLLFKKLEKSFLIVTSSHEAAREIYQEIAFFHGEKQCGCAETSENVLLFSSPETHPYENVLSHCEVSARRMWTLYRLCDAQETGYCGGKYQSAFTEDHTC